MFPAALEIVAAANPRAVLFENVQGLATAKFESYRRDLLSRLTKLGYQSDWRVLQAADFGVPQLRPRFILVALRPSDAEHFAWPVGARGVQTVGATLLSLMAENGWHGAEAWAARANGIGPTIVGGSKKHGGPDLGPTRAKREWRELAVDGMGIADTAPAPEAPFDHFPRLTVRMVARLQSFPDTWEFTGGKTAAYRQVGNAFPPNVARVVGAAIRAALARSKKHLRADETLEGQLRLLEEPAVYRVTRRRKT
jgi:DNA (cytosine-5)-methyltransferase 1